MANIEGVMVQSVGRALEIVRCFEGESEELGISELSDQIMLNKSTIYGLVNTLAANGFLEQNPHTRKYRLGIKLFELGNLVQKRMDIRNEAKPYCRKLADKYRSIVHLAAYYDGEIVYIDKVDIQDFSIAYSYVGKRAKMHCTGVGKAILAYLPEEEVRDNVLNKPLQRFTDNTITSPERLLKELEVIRIRGYAADNEETEPGLVCIAAPILDHHNRPVAAISCSGPGARMSEQTMTEMSKDVIAFAKSISERMGHIK